MIDEDSSGLYEASGLKDAFEKLELEMEKKKTQEVDDFWGSPSLEVDIFDEPAEIIEVPEEVSAPAEIIEEILPPEDEIDPFWHS